MLAPCTCPYVTGSAGLPVPAHEAADLDPEMERKVRASCKVRARAWAEDFLRRQGRCQNCGAPADQRCTCDY